MKFKINIYKRTLNLKIYLNEAKRKSFYIYSKCRNIVLKMNIRKRRIFFYVFILPFFEYIGAIAAIRGDSQIKKVQTCLRRMQRMILSLGRNTRNSYLEKIFEDRAPIWKNRAYKITKNWERKQNQIPNNLVTEISLKGNLDWLIVRKNLEKLDNSLIDFWNLIDRSKCKSHKKFINYKHLKDDHNLDVYEEIKRTFRQGDKIGLSRIVGRIKSLI